MPRMHHWLMNKFDFVQISKRHLYFYNVLKNKFQALAGIPDLLKTGIFVPFFFVIKLEDRDTLRKVLFNQNMYAPVHWFLPKEVDMSFPLSHKLSVSILSIPFQGLNDEACNKIENLTKTIFA